jgi:hypothetical protein
MLAEIAGTIVTIAFASEPGDAGLIDLSRRRPGLWHVILMRWNEPGAPRVRRVGTPVPISMEADKR